MKEVLRLVKTSMDFGGLIELFTSGFFVIVIAMMCIKSSVHIAKTSKNTKVGKFKNLSSILIGIGVFILILTGFQYLDHISQTSETNTAKADGFTIEKFHVQLDVKETNEIFVTENINVDFYGYGHHGIYRTVPSWLEYTSKDNKTISRKAVIENLRAVNEKYEVTETNKKKKIRIGDPEKILDVGKKDYTIKYHYYLGKDPYNGYDEFIFHTYGDYWGTQIQNASVEINMPKEIEKDKIKVFTDKYRKMEVTNRVEIMVVENTIYIDVPNDLNLARSLTVDIELPEGYFTNSKDTYGNASFLLCILIILMTGISYFLWFKYGKDFKQPNSTNTLNLEEFDASSIGYIYKKEGGPKLAVSTLLQLVSKEYIKMDKEGNKTFITNLCPFDLNHAIHREIIVKKLKDGKSSSDKNAIEALFKGNEVVRITDNFDSFTEHYESLVNKNYIEIEKDTLNDYTEESKKEIINTLEKTAFEGKKPLSTNEKIAYDHLFTMGNTFILEDDKDFYKLINEINMNLSNELDDKIYDVTSYKMKAVSALLLMISTIFFYLSYCVIEDMNPNYRSLYTISIIAIGLTILFTCLMTRKNEYGEELVKRIDMLKEQLETMDQNELTEDPSNYFFQMLPYAYVLGASKEYSKQFKNLKKLANRGNYDYYSPNSCDKMEDSIPKPPSSSNGGGCGSGCSSCGGGCSSCGGGGSW